MERIFEETTIGSSKVRNRLEGSTTMIAGEASRIAAVYFSPTHTTKKIVSALAKQMGEAFGCGIEEIDLTLPSGRNRELVFGSEDIVILGLPVYGGRIPELLEDAVKAMRGDGTRAAAVALYGNREYEDALVEMEDLLTEGGFCLVGAGAFLGEHSLTDQVAGGRPDDEDMKKAEAFGNHLIQNLKEKRVPSLKVRGNRPYKARKAGAAYGPKTTDECNGCMICAKHCPVGIISFDDPKEVSEGCLHCAACVKGCPVQAKYFDADGYYMIKNMLEEKCRTRKEPELFY